MLIFFCIAFSLFLSLSIGYLVNSIFNNSMLFLKDNESMFNKHNVFQVILPSFLLLCTLISIIFSIDSVAITIIEIFMIFYVGLIFFLYNLKRSSKRKIINFRKQLVNDIIEPWLKQNSDITIEYSLNLHIKKDKITGEVIFNIDQKLLPIVTLNDLRNKLLIHNIYLHFRPNNLPKFYKIT